MRKELFLLWCFVYVCFFSFFSHAQIIKTVAGNGVAGFIDSVSATSAELNFPEGVALDTAHNIYIADYSNYKIRKVNSSGTMVTIAGLIGADYSGDGGPATEAHLNFPQDIVVTRSGNIFIADAGNNVIRKIDTSGTISTVAGNNTNGFSGDGGAATLAQLDQPTGVAVDAIGNIYIADYNNYRVRKVDTSGIITTIAGNGFGAGTGMGGYSGDGGAATAAELFYPTGVAVDPAGNVFIADGENNVVRKVSASGIITTVAGSGISGSAGDTGLATSAQLYLPAHIALDTVGNLYIADMGNNRIRKVNTLGIITTIAGTGIPGATGDNGSAVLARLNQPQGITVTNSGRVYIADANNSRIRSISVSGYAPVFTGGAAQSITVCENSLSNSISYLLSIRDSDMGQAETWTISTAPAHGTLSGFTAAATATGGIITPSGIAYIPSPGFSGADVFTIRVSDGRVATTTTIHVTVAPLPVVGPIIGVAHLCVSDSIVLADSVSGGLWSTSGADIAITGGGDVYAINIGTDTVYYVVTNSCGSTTAKKTVTSYPSADAGIIVGPSGVCVGDSIFLLTASATTVTDSGGIWSTSNPAATINSVTGVLTGVIPNMDTVFYTVFNGCDTSIALQTIAVSTLPSADSIVGLNSICQGYSLILTDPAGTGAWYTSNAAAYITTDGLLVALSGGVDTVSYIVSNACADVVATKVITIDAAPIVSDITGASSICAGASIMLTDAAPGGIWTTGNASAAVTSTGEIIGLSDGVDTVKYIVANSCGIAVAVKVITVNPLPLAGNITGADTVCQTRTITLSDTASGGVWTSKFPALAGVSSSGVVTGMAPGIDSIIYRVTNACGTVKTEIQIDVRSAEACGIQTGVNTISTATAASLQLFPNPTDGDCTFNLLAPTNEAVHIVITNIAGERVKELTTTTNKQEEIHLNRTAGIYLLSATTASGTYMARIAVY